MKWITRERARVDRIACPWLITRFVDPAPEFLFVPPGDVMAVAGREQAIPYDVPDVELGHHGPRCSFDAFLERYDLDDPALVALAEIVRGADTDHRALTPESAGLYAAATGFQAISRDDHDNMARQFPLYDALYDFCRARAKAPPTKRVLSRARTASGRPRGQSRGTNGQAAGRSRERIADRRCGAQSMESATRRGASSRTNRAHPPRRAVVQLERRWLRPPPRPMRAGHRARRRSQCSG